MIPGIHPGRLVVFLSICTVFVMFSFVATAAEDSDKPGATVGKPEKVSIDFNNVDINVFIKFISKLTGKNFVVDRRVKGKVTIVSPTKISIKQAYKVFESVLEINGFSTVKSGQVIKIVPTPKAKGDNLDTRIATDPINPEQLKDKMVTRIIPLEYARAEELRKLFTPMLPQGSVILSYGETNMLVVTATLSSIDRVLKIVKAIDRESVGKIISVVPVQYADVNKLVKNLSSVFTAQARDPKTAQRSDLDVKFVPDDRTNSVILLASKLQTGRVKNLIKILDQKMPKGEERIRVYYLEHASAENIVTVLQEIPSTKRQDSQRPGQKKAPILSEKIKMMAHKATNSLVIMADKEDYPVLEDVIKKLDIPRSMVYIECLIMEVNFTKGLNIGTEWKTSEQFDRDSKTFFGGFGATGGSGDTNLSGVTGSGIFPTGFSLGVLGEAFQIGDVTFPDIQAVVQAFKNDKDVHILATPQILTTENEEASITVGKNVPFQTRSAAEDATATYSSFEYKDVGISLKITPQISKDRLVRLEVYQQLTKLDTVNQASPDRPTTFKREIDTTIIVEDGNSVVIGGLIDESLTKTENKTPCLGDIPFFGWGFKSLSRGEDKTNLYVFLTPKVVRSPLELDEIYKEKAKDIESLKTGEVSLYEKLKENQEKKEKSRSKDLK